MTTLRQACKDTRGRCGTSLSLEVESRVGGIKARRDMLFALWVGRRGKLDARGQEAFAWSIHFADLDDDTLVAEADRRLREAGRPLPAHQLYHHLREMELRAYLHLSEPVATARVRRRDRDTADSAA